jgi:hypothetical protein
MSVAPDAGLAVGHSRGVEVGASVGGRGVSVAVGLGVNVGGIGEDVDVGGISVGGFGVEPGAHPLNKTVSTTNTMNTDCIGFLMTLSPFDLVAHNAPNGGVHAPT